MDMPIATHLDDNASQQDAATNFLVCADGREESVVALKLACHKAAKRSANVTILHVIEPGQSQSFMGVTEKMREERVEEAQALLHRLSEVAQDILPAAPALLLREGPIGETIMHSIAHGANINLMMLGVATDHNTRGSLIEWVSSQLGHGIMIPVMLVPGNLNDAQIAMLS